MKIIPLDLKAWRIVEDQSKSSTRRLVNSDLEHQILEEIIEENKPPIPLKAQQLSHYLLYTPYRYRGKIGTRFAAFNHPSIFYASLELETAMAEVAYHRLAFLNASNQDLSCEVSRTSFSAQVKTTKGLDLINKKVQQDIYSVSSYKESQKFGQQLRQKGIASFVTQSVRLADGKNVNVIDPSALSNNSYKNIENSCMSWACYATRTVVEFRHKTDIKIPTKVFKLTDFVVDEEFPVIS